MVLLNFVLSGNLIKRVVMPPGAVSLDDVDLDQVSIDYVLSCAKKGQATNLYLCSSNFCSHKRKKKKALAVSLFLWS